MRENERMREWENERERERDTERGTERERQRERGRERGREREIEREYDDNEKGIIIKLMRKYERNDQFRKLIPWEFYCTQWRKSFMLIR